MDGQGERVTRPAEWWRVSAVSGSVVALVLWVWSGWDWWVLVPLVVGLVLVRLVLGVVPGEWRRWLSERAPVALVAVVVWLARLVPWTALGVAVGAGGLVAVWLVRGALPARPRWVAVGVLVALAAGCGTAAVWGWADERARREADERAAREYRVADLRPDRPLAVLHLVVKAIHEQDPALICFHMFTPDAEAAFARSVGADGCESAVTVLHGQITGKGYGNATASGPDVVWETGDEPASVSGCRMYVTDGPLSQREPPGPRLGVFRLERDPRYPDTGYRITGYTPCDVAESTSTSAGPPPVLPSYPPAFAGILARAVAAADRDVCGIFTTQGAEQFAATVEADSCPGAVAALHERVTDATAYANPSGATSAETSAGVEVNACALTWTRWGTGDTTAGPQLGHLSLISPDPGSPGYLIDGVRAC